MFDPSIGRWIEEDPIGFEAGDVDLYRYCGNNPTSKTDPSGLDPDQQVERNLQRHEREATKNYYRDLEKQFADWYTREKNDKAWLKDVPIPPNELKFETRTQLVREMVDPGVTITVKVQMTVPVLPEGWVWDSNFAMHTLGYHPNAKYGMRSKNWTTAGSGAQAMYDKDGKIITGGLSAGTADRVSPEKDPLGHRKVDVIPFDQAWELDRHFGVDKYRRMYIEVRPPNTAKDAPENFVN
jgi:uncharacterized protein RhaS with RHS repeats